MGTGRIYQWFGDETEPAANPFTAAAATSSAGAAPTNGVALRLRARTVDAATDQTIQLMFALPSNYASGGTLSFKFSGVSSGNVIWKTAYALIHPASEATPTAWSAASFGTVSTTTAAAASNTGYMKEVSIDLGVTGAHGGDLLAVLLGRDADNVSDTAAACSFLEPWLLTYTTV